MKRAIIYFILLMTLCTLRAQTTHSASSEKLSLLRQLSQTAPNDTTRLGIYLRLIELSQEEKVKAYYSDKLLQDAQRLNSSKYQCEAYVKQMISAYNQYDAAKVNHWMSLLEPIATKEKLYNYYFRGRRCVIDMMMINGEYEREIKAAQQMLQHARELNNNIGIVCAYNCLANAYSMTYQSEKAAEVLETAYPIALTTDIWFTIEINNSLISSYQALGDYKNWFKWISIMDNFLQEQVKKDPKIDRELQGPKMMVAVSYIIYYTSINDLKKAGEYIKIAEKYNVNDYNVYNYYHRRARYIYFQRCGMHEEALIESDALADMYKEISPLTYSGMIFIKANILKDLNRYDEALDIYKQAFSISDSVNIAYLNKQTEQLKKDYNTEQLLLEKEGIKKRIQMLYIALVIIISIIFVMFAVHASKVRIKLKKSEEEMRGMAEEMEMANIAKEHFLSSISTEISTPLNAVVSGALKLTTDEIYSENERKEISQELNKTSAELMALINNILNLSRLEAGMMKFKMEKIEILTFIAEFIRMESIRGKKINANLPEVATPLNISADISRFQEIFSSIFSIATDETLQVDVTVDEGRQKIDFRISGSILSIGGKISRDITMTNEINRLTVGHFNGRYEVDANRHIVSVNIPIV